MKQLTKISKNMERIIKISLAVFATVLIMTSCEESSYYDDNSSSSSFNDYNITVNVYNSDTYIGVSNIKIKLGAKDTGLNSEVGDFGCKDLGTKTVNSSGRCTFTCENFAGSPSVCEVAAYDIYGNSISSTYIWWSESLTVNVYID